MLQTGGWGAGVGDKAQAGAIAVGPEALARGLLRGTGRQPGCLGYGIMPGSWAFVICFWMSLLTATHQVSVRAVSLGLQGVGLWLQGGGWP